MNPIKYAEALTKKIEKWSNLERFLWSGMLVAHPDVCLYLKRDFKIDVSRKLTKIGEKRGFRFFRFGWLVAGVRY